MNIFNDVAKILVGLAVVGACLWLWTRFLAFLDAHGVRLPLRRGDPRQEPSKVEVQTLFHGIRKMKIRFE